MEKQLDIGCNQNKNWFFSREQTDKIETVTQIRRKLSAYSTNLYEQRNEKLHAVIN